METAFPLAPEVSASLKRGHRNERSYADRREVVEVMKAQESHHKTAVTAHAEKVDTSDRLLGTAEEKQNGDVSRQNQNREDLKKTFNEPKESDAQLADSEETKLRTIID